LWLSARSALRGWPEFGGLVGKGEIVGAAGDSSKHDKVLVTIANERMERLTPRTGIGFFNCDKHVTIGDQSARSD
jgi:hypothetical protein